MLDKLYTRFLERCRALDLEPSNDVLCVSIGEQKLGHWKAQRLLAIYRISTSRRPPSCVENSLGTPTGLHMVAEKIGVNAPLGMIFKGRVAQGTCFQELDEEANQPNLITSRILWLRGLEPGLNQGPGIDTYQRYVYIHGTNHEERLGSPDSHGCVLMNNAEIIALYKIVPPGTQVFIA